jgi:hypothetical protein
MDFSAIEALLSKKVSFLDGCRALGVLLVEVKPSDHIEIRALPRLPRPDPSEQGDGSCGESRTASPFALLWRKILERRQDRF